MIGRLGHKLAAVILLIAALGVAEAAPTAPTTDWRCGTPGRLADIASLPRADWPVVYGAHNLAAKSERDAFGGGYVSQASDNFILKWSDPATITEVKVTTILAAAEAAWQVFVADMGHRLPIGASDYYVNIYYGYANTNPSIDFAGGYVTFDDDGFPYIVLSADLRVSALTTVTTHEFYHVVQLSTGAFANSWDGYWFFEATAEWSVAEVLGGGGCDFLGAYVLLPEVSLDHFGDTFSDTLLGTHQYGAFIFPRFVTEYVTDRGIIRDAWEESTDDDDPLDVMAAALAALGTNLDAVFANFAAHNATIDYAARPEYLSFIELFADYYADQAHPIAATIPIAGSDGWSAAPAATEPWAYGYNVFKLTAPMAGEYELAVAGDGSGSHGTSADYRATVVSEQANRVAEYFPVPMEGDGGAITIATSGTERALYLVVSAHPASSNQEGETFGFAYQVSRPRQIAAPAAPETELTYDREFAGDWGIGCSNTSESAPTGLVVLIAVIALIGRRRRRE